MSYFSNGQNYMVEGYRIAKDHYSADAIVIYSNLGEVDANAPVTVVDKVVPVLDEEGEEAQKLFGYRNGAAVEYLFRDDQLLNMIFDLNANPNDSQDDKEKHKLECGDIVQLEIDELNQIIGVKLIYQRNINKGIFNMAQDTNARYRTFMGKAYNISEGYLMLVSTETFDNPNMQDKLASLTLNSLEVYPGTILPIVVYDHTKENKLSIGKLGDIVDYKSTLQASDVFVYTSYSSNGMIVVYK